MSRTKRLAAVIIMAFTAVGFAAAPALAHQNQISGTAVCNPETGQYDVTWSNHGDAARFGDSVITASSRASVATGQTIPADQTVVVGTESVPGTTTTLTLTETWLWPRDGFKIANTGSVSMAGTCVIPVVSNPKATADCEHIVLDNSGSTIPVSFTVSVNNAQTVKLVPAGQTVTLPSPGDQAHVVITVGEQVLLDVTLDCAHVAPTAIAKAGCVDHHPIAVVVLDNSASNRDTVFDIALNGAVIPSRHVTVPAGAGVRINLNVSVGDQIEVTVGNDVLASTVVHHCSPKPDKPKPLPPPDNGLNTGHRGTALTGPSIKRPMMALFGFALLGAVLLMVSRKPKQFAAVPAIGEKP
jgi:hypothetical protein